MLGFLGVADEPPVREFFDAEINADAAHRERWRKGLSEAEQEQITDLYETTLERLEAEGYHCAPVLRRSYERTLERLEAEAYHCAPVLRRSYERERAMAA